MAPTRRARSLVSVLLVCAVACGGSGAPGAGSGSPTTAPTRTPRPHQRPGWDYVAMGDSIATGLHSGISYPEAFAALVHGDTGKKVRLDSWAANGATSEDLLSQLNSKPDLRDALAEAEIITWNIGGNDFNQARKDFVRGSCGGADGERCLRQAAAGFEQRLGEIFDAVVAIRSPRHTIIRFVGTYFPFAGLRSGSAQLGVLLRYADEVEAFMARAARDRGIGFADVLTRFNGPNHDEDPTAKGLIGSDLIHPTEEGQRAIAEVLRDLGYAPLR